MGEWNSPLHKPSPPSRTRELAETRAGLRRALSRVAGFVCVDVVSTAPSV